MITRRNLEFLHGYWRDEYAPDEVQGEALLTYFMYEHTIPDAIHFLDRPPVYVRMYIYNLLWRCVLSFTETRPLTDHSKILTQRGNT